MIRIECSFFQHKPKYIKIITQETKSYAKNNELSYKKVSMYKAILNKYPYMAN